MLPPGPRIIPRELFNLLYLKKEWIRLSGKQYIIVLLDLLNLQQATFKFLCISVTSIEETSTVYTGGIQPGVYKNILHQSKLNKGNA
jgi:hypothetical protein